MEPPAPASRRSTAHPLPVAELLARYGGGAAPVAEPTAADAAVSVGSLMRREGRGPHALDRPLVPRGHSRPLPLPTIPAQRSRGGRRASVATGALLMAGAVLGTAVVEESVATRPDAPGTGTGEGTAAPGQAKVPQQRSGPAATTSGPTRAVSFLVPLAPTSAGPTAGTEQPVASGASIGRGALAPSGAGLPAPAPGAVTAPPAVPVPVGLPPVNRPPAQPPSGAVLQPPQGTAQPPQDTTRPPQGAVPPSQESAQPPAAVTVKPPPVQTPAVEVPAVTAPDLPVLGTVHTPTVDVSPAVVQAPTVSVSTSDGVAAGTGPAEVVTPDVGVGAVQAGPVGLSGTAVTVPDVALTKASVDLSPGGADVALPGVSVSKTTVVTPDVKLGPVDVPLPDVTLPAVTVPSVELPVGTPLKAVTGVVGSLLGGR